MRRAAKRGGTRSPASNPAAGRGRLPAAQARGALGARRLTRRGEFDAVYRTGRRLTSRQFTVFVAANGLPENRFGMSVGRALGGAVVRNRIRRRVRELLRLSGFELPHGWDFVVHPRASVAQADFALLRSELLGLLRNSIPSGSVPSRGGQPARDGSRPVAGGGMGKSAGKS